MPPAIRAGLGDTLNVISGKWKLPIIASILYGMNRFKELQDNIEKITPRMLSKELKDLEVNGIVERRVYDQKPVLIEYRLTESGKNIVSVMESCLTGDWRIERGFLPNSYKVANRMPLESVVHPYVAGRG